MKLSFKQMKKVFFNVCALVTVMFLTSPVAEVSANKGDWSQWVGNSSGTSYTKLYNDLENIVKVIIVLGGLWVIACLIFAGIRLAGSQGSNPQARTQGFIGLAMAAIGGFVIVKAYDIAAYIANFGSIG